MIGSTSFDGFSQTSSWTNLLADVRSRLADESLRVVDLATTPTNVAGLAFFVLLVVVTYFAAIAVAQRLVRAPRSLTRTSCSRSSRSRSRTCRALLLLLPHPRPVRDPADLGPVRPGWDLFGTADFAPNLAIVSPQTVWYVKCVALTAGHVAGLAIAHDRAVAMFEDGAPLYAPVPDAGADGAYTVGGLWVLSRS